MLVELDAGEAEALACAIELNADLVLLDERRARHRVSAGFGADRLYPPRVFTLQPPFPLERLRQSPWYRALYLKRSDKTKQRDWCQLRELGLVRLEAGQVRLGLG